MNQSIIEHIRDELKAPKKALSAIPGLTEMFEKCFLNTLETTLQEDEDGGAYVITGDIPAMWLRDSTQQVMHYLRFVKRDEALRKPILAVIERQAKYVLIDPYANAFNISANGRHGYEDIPAPNEHVWECKYELDSLCHVVLLASRYYEATGSDDYMTETFCQALRTIIHVIKTEQNHAESPYSFQRPDAWAPSDTLSHEGKGAPVAPVGLSWCGFRPSDDACQYGYLIPANLFAAEMLFKAAAMAERAGDGELKKEALKLREEILSAVQRYGVVDHPVAGEIYAYETDGLGHWNLMDDANVPSLLSLPYLGVCEKGDERYLRTRRFVLSKENPYYYEGKAARGIGSPHTPKNYIWPIALCIQGMTTDDLEEKAQILRTLLATDAGTGFMHEGFDKDDPSQFTRPWFAWANSMFGEFVYRMFEEGVLAEVVSKAS